MLKKYLLCLFFLLINTMLFGEEFTNYTEFLVLVNSDSHSYTFCKTKTKKGKEVYVLNSRYKIKNDYRSVIGDDADFMFTFYIIPENNDLHLEEIEKPSEIILAQSSELQKVKESLLASSTYSSLFTFKLVIKVGDKYYKFKNCYVEGQAFSLQETPQYFPKFGLGSNKFELNPLAKPYSPATIDSLRKIISKDTSGLKPFGAWVEDFYDKWFIRSIDRSKKTLNFWIDLKNISNEGYAFGRFAKEITYKINVGVVNFKVFPVRPVFSDDYFDNEYLPVEFNFQNFVDLNTFLKDR